MIRLAIGDDAPAILEIYRPAIEHSSISFETAVPTSSEMRGRIESCLQQYPWIVEVERDVVRGYAYASRYHPRAAYQWAAIVSVYVADNCLRQGVGAQLYRALFSLLERQGVRQALAAIAVPNPASQQFHEAIGFRQAGLMPDVGYKLGQWQSMGWWQRPLGTGADGAPSKWIPFYKLIPSLPSNLGGFID